MSDSKSEKKLTITMCAIVIGLFLTNIAYLIQNRTGITYTTIGNVCKIVILVLLIICAPIFLKRFTKRMLVLIFSLVYIYLINRYLFKQGEIFAQTFIVYLTNVLPAILIFSVIRDYDRLLDYLRKAVLIISLLLLIVSFSGRMISFDADYAMGFANSLTFPTIVSIDNLFDGKRIARTRIITSIAIFVNVFNIVVYGSRGAFISIVVFTIYIVFKQWRIHKTPGYLVAVVGLVLVMCFSNYLLSYFLNLILQKGYNSRTINLLLTEIYHDSGRFSIWKEVLHEIWINPIAIRGINADYLLIGGYSHNYFIELIYAFGIPLGGGICLYIISNIIKTALKGYSLANMYRIETMLLFSFFPLCLWSGSIWTSMYFWSWLTVVLAEKKQMRYMQITNE